MNGYQLALALAQEVLEALGREVNPDSLTQRHDGSVVFDYGARVFELWVLVGSGRVRLFRYGGTAGPEHTGVFELADPDLIPKLIVLVGCKVYSLQQARRLHQEREARQIQQS